MALVDLVIGKRQFQLECPDTERDKIKSLAAELDKRICQLAESFGESNDKMLLIMTALTMQDEINELKNKQSFVNIQGVNNSKQSEALRHTADSMAAICDYIEDIAEKIKSA